MSEYTGKDVSYYLVTIAKPKRLDPYTAECEDIIEALGMSFAEGCAFKAIWRKCAARTLGVTKAGYKGGLYDAEKTHYYGARMVAAEERLLPAAPDEDVFTQVRGANDPIQRAIKACMSRRKASDSFAYATQNPACPECGYPTDAAGTHYATCSQLTAPEEYKAEAQVAFDEAAELSEALARQVSSGQIPDPAYSHCPHCGSPEGYLHNPDCNTMRRGKSRLGKTLAEIQAAQAAQGEPAAAMDDDSPRMQAIGQNGNDGEHYDDPWAGAPEWAEYKAQDEDGRWNYYSRAPDRIDQGEFKPHHDDLWWGKPPAECTVDGEPNPNWRDTLITRT